MWLPISNVWNHSVVLVVAIEEGVSRDRLSATLAIGRIQAEDARVVHALSSRWEPVLRPEAFVERHRHLHAGNARGTGTKCGHTGSRRCCFPMSSSQKKFSRPLFQEAVVVKLVIEAALAEFGDGRSIGGRTAGEIVELALPRVGGRKSPVAAQSVCNSHGWRRSGLTSQSFESAASAVCPYLNCPRKGLRLRPRVDEVRPAGTPSAVPAPCVPAQGNLCLFNNWFVDRAAKFTRAVLNQSTRCWLYSLVLKVAHRRRQRGEIEARKRQGALGSPRRRSGCRGLPGMGPLDTGE